MLDDNTYLNCLLENLNRKIDKLDMLKRWFYIDDVDSTIHINDKTKIVERCI